VHQIVSRVVEPSETAVISVGYIQGGQAFNVIPDTVELGGTIRLTDPKSQFEPLFETITLRVKDIASAFGCSADVIDRNGEAALNSRGKEFKIFAFPPRYNDDFMLDLGLETAKELFGGDTTSLSRPSTGCEDFAFISEAIPSAAFNIGTKHPDDAKGEGTGSPGHNSLFDIDERALPRGAAFYATYAMTWVDAKTAASREEL